MEQTRQGELARIFVKRQIARELRLSDIASLKRDLGNVSKETGVPKDDLLRFVAIIIREIFEEQHAALSA